ncbi:metal-dependent transcriptional regulator [Kocuria sp.]|uniref:metal-dependent transcriptional regulator n=1 Tax=Kocuria sp. TaxID=1871328 RepID=UPI0026E031CC|nr:metal-dependent transcriptional regulator [Kocuria sp.]MDO5619521.1 metal-dependent transcriptional regulator [Kocuria sp.]
MTDLIDTTEMYLRTVLELEEEGIPPMRARIVERLDHSGPTVSQTVSRMERDGLLTVLPDRRIALTDDGRETAVKVMRKHRLAERLLADVIGLELSQVHDEACRWEHVMSEDVERRLMVLLDAPEASPYGMPIPGLDGLTAEDEQTAINALLAAPSGALANLPRLLTMLRDGATGPFTLLGVPEVVQADGESVPALAEAGVLTGAAFTAELDDDDWVVIQRADTSEAGAQVRVSNKVAQALCVTQV